MKLVIDRKHWWRGQGGSGSALLLKDGKMCCLGFLGKACDVSKDFMQGWPYPVTPMALSNGDPNWPSWLFDVQERKREVRHIMAGVNDETKITEVEREATLTKMFAEHGWEVEFIN